MSAVGWHEHRHSCQQLRMMMMAWKPEALVTVTRAETVTMTSSSSQFTPAPSVGIVSVGHVWDRLGPLDRGAKGDDVAFGGSSDRPSQLIQLCPPGQRRFPASLSWYLGLGCDTSGDNGSPSAMRWDAFPER